MNINHLDEVAALGDDEIQRRLAATRDILERAGAHYVIDSIADIEPVIEDIEARLAAGEKP